MMPCRVLKRSVRTDVGQHSKGQKPILCFTKSTSRSQQREGSRLACRCKVSKDRDQLPVVDDADVVVLPPPPTGSQYAWRHSWRGFSFSSGGGNGGKSGRSQARTRDWGSGPRSSLLLVIMYRIRMLLLYGVWVTVLYGALHALTDLVKGVARCTAGMAVHAAKWANGLGSSSSDGRDTGFGDPSAAEAVPAGGAAGGAAAACVAVAGCEADDAASGGAAVAEGKFRDIIAAKYGGDTSATAADLVSSVAPAIDEQEESFAARFACAQDRPSAKPFTGLMSVIVPVYLMLMGSILFFASM